MPYVSRPASGFRASAPPLARRSDWDSAALLRERLVKVPADALVTSKIAARDQLVIRQAVDDHSRRVICRADGWTQRLRSTKEAPC